MKIIFLKYKIIFNIKISKQSKNTKRIIFKQKNKKKNIKHGFNWKNKQQLNN
jgi:hypothetical protein